LEKEKVLNRIKDLGLLAVIRGPNEELTIKAVDALIAGGVFGIEITFSTPNAYKVVEILEKKYGREIVLGMGTLTKAEQVERAIDLGAQFVVSPMYEENLCDAMVNSGLLSMMGSFTPTEIFRTFSRGVDVIKIFPGSLGGPDYIRDLRGPFPDIPIMPTGGVNKENVKDWFKAGALAVGAGSNLCPKELVIQQKWIEITEIAKDFSEILKKVRG